jgi:Tfp pilus assembly protein PilF
MIVIHPLDNFIYTLFPDIDKNLNSLEHALTEFYAVGNIKPVIEFNNDFVSITIDYLKIETENKKSEKLIALCESGKFEEASALVKELLTSNPSHSEYHRIQGQIYSELGGQEEAINSLIYALRWDPKNEWALVMMGNIFAKFKNDVDTAMKYYDQVLVLKPNDSLTLYNMGANLMQLGKKEGAINYFHQAIASNEDYPNTYYGLALIAHGEEDYKKAFDQALTALSKTNKRIDRQLYTNALQLALEAAKSVMEGIDTDAIIKKFTSKLAYLSEKEIKIEVDETILTAAKIEFAENYDRPYHLVKYKSSYSGVGHLLLHELLHLELVIEAREKEVNELFVTNQSNKAKFIFSLEKHAVRWKKNGVSETNINNYFTALFNGINSQIYNTPIDLFIEDRIHTIWEEMRPIQFLSLLALLQEGIQANTHKDIVENTPATILSLSKIYNLINALHFKSLFEVDLIDQFNPTKSELKQANELYAEFQEYRADKAPAEEYELVKHWGEDLKLDHYFELVPESDYRKKTIDTVLEGIQNDPLGLHTTDASQERKMKKFLEANASEGLNMAVAMFMSDAINYFKKVPLENVKKIAFEIATIGTQGIDPNKKNYAIPSIKDSSFSGYKTLAYYYVSWAIAVPESVNQLQLPFDKEYALASKFLKG